jgi:hypothetical protein
MAWWWNKRFKRKCFSWCYLDCHMITHKRCHYETSSVCTNSTLSSLRMWVYIPIFLCTMTSYVYTKTQPWCVVLLLLKLLNHSSTMFCARTWPTCSCVCMIVYVHLSRDICQDLPRTQASLCKKTVMRIWRVYMKCCSGERWAKGLMGRVHPSQQPLRASPAYLNTSCSVII